MQNGISKFKKLMSFLYVVNRNLDSRLQHAGMTQSGCTILDFGM